ncbi:hypothetical protein COCHEDRAFT_1225432 [Bipolaris maydis C5]|uniref:Septin-type G domain-containing protein n=1 Tax=Cochliobolus heterostrophus (strain C5 / ATCC 48332 / race O) TaxID=701091 RepID=M2UPJ3_COCH5|nr:hypothetical protein COCHEDRAFT_1225432 [Bipolaris maydis C5]KAJ5064074.1 hypothetical protein J3E74DRAFT_262279 [Bipolaris maydis]KAJ6207668.1 hypothetical protein PSV09DRAFT_1225432 [Bipolaris maydis]
MRPIPGGDALTPAVKPRSRKSSIDPVAPVSHVPTSFVFKRFEDLEQTAPPLHAATSSARHEDHGTYGVQSLADTLEAAFGPEDAPKRTDSLKAERTKGHAAKSPRPVSHGSSIDSATLPEDTRANKTWKLKRNHSNHGSYIPLKLPGADVSSSYPTSAMPSTPTSASITSLKLSDEDSIMDETVSQAAMSSAGEEDHVEIQQDGLSFPQLVMPVMQMPTRRPFTTKGKAMSKLKLMVVGETGVGKSSLVRSIVQACEDIVHVDPLPTPQSTSRPRASRSKSRASKPAHAGTTRVTEIHASTKPYPHWWTDLDDSRAPKKRKGTSDSVLERNICFVDTPGYFPGPTEADDIGTVVNYVESLFYQTSSVVSLEDSDALGLVSGNGGVLVDVVIYLLAPGKDISKDIEYMQRLSYLTNVIPIIAKSDTLSAHEVVALKTSILAQLQTTAFRPFFFGETIDDALLNVQGLSLPKTPVSSASSEENQYPFTTSTYPYAVSSTLGLDHDNMDASLLMSPDYVQPLLPSELTALVNQIFDPESITWLRHSAAKKFVAWRHRVKLPGESIMVRSIAQPRSPTTASIGLNGATSNPSLASSVFSATSPSGVLVPGSGSPFYPSNLQSPILASSTSLANSEALEPPPNFSLARYGHAPQGDQRFSEIRIARWATDLQRSRRNERDRFDELQSKERARWMLECVNEEAAKGSLVATSPGAAPRAEWAMVRHGDEKNTRGIGNRYARAMVGLDSRDPLGLCNLSDELKRRSYALVKVLGGVSVLGAVIVAVSRACGMEAGLVPAAWWRWVSAME